jgi:hypothetical protein
MPKQTFDSYLHNIIAGAGKRLPRAAAADPLSDDSWQLDDGTVLYFEPCDEELLIILRMPERHLDVHQLMQLLMLGDGAWPISLATGLSADEAQALLFTRIRIASLDIDILLQVILTLLHVRKRWLQTPPSPMAGRSQVYSETAL